MANKSSLDKTENSTIRAGIWYVICNFILKGIALFTTPFFTRILSKADVGYFSNVQSWYNLLSVIITLNLSGSIFLAYFDYKKKLEKYVSSILVLSSASTFAFYLMILIFKDFFLNLFSIDEYVLHIMFFAIAFQQALDMFNIENRVQGKYKSTVIFSLLNCILSNAIAIVLVYFFKMGILGRVVGFYAPQIMVNLCIYMYVIYRGKGIEIRFIPYALKLSLPLIFHNLGHILLSSSDRIMITKLCGTDNTALYSIAYSCGSIVSLLWSSMNNAWSPWAYSCMNMDDREKLKRASKAYSLSFVVVVFCIMLVAPEVLWILGGKSYANSVGMIPVVMISYVFVFVYSLYVNIEFFFKKQNIIAVGTVIAAVLNLGLNYLLIPIFGYVAAAYTTLIGYAFLFVYNYLNVKKLKKTYFYDTKFFIAILAISICLIPAIQFLYQQTTIRYIIICGITCLSIYSTICKRKEIVASIKKKSIMGVIEAYSSFFINRRL